MSKDGVCSIHSQTPDNALHLVGFTREPGSGAEFLGGRVPASFFSPVKILRYVINSKKGEWVQSGCWGNLASVSISTQIGDPETGEKMLPVGLVKEPLIL